MMGTPAFSSRLEPAAGFHPRLITEISNLRPLGLHDSAVASAPDTSAAGSSASQTSAGSASSCSLHLLYHLSSSIILDQYQLRQLHNEGRLITSQLSQHGGGSPSSRSKGKGRPVDSQLELGGQLDLEAPASQVDPGLPAIAFLTVPMETKDLPMGFLIPSVDVTVDIPLHIRYQEPVLSRWLSPDGRSGHGGHWWSKHPMPINRTDIQDVQVQWPCVFWACEHEEAEASEDNSPYKLMETDSSCIDHVPSELRLSVPTSSPLHPNTIRPFHYLLQSHSTVTTTDTFPSDTGAIYSSIKVPTGSLGDAKVVHVVNLAVTWLGFLLVVYKVISFSRQWRQNEQVAKTQADANEQSRKTD